MAAALQRDATVAVIGAGTMGAGIAQVAAQAGHPVRLFDTRIGAADEACESIAETLSQLVAKGKLAKSDADGATARLKPIHTLADCVSASLVIEAIVEDLAAKHDLLRELELIVSADTILASNTSSLSITALAAGLKRPERVVGMHFFNPVPRMPLVEVVSGLTTDGTVADTIYALAAAWGKAPVYASSTPSFIVNRCARPFYGEGLRLLGERATDAPTLDAVMRDAGGFRMGPFELIDLIGLDVNYAVTRSVWEAFFHDPRYAPSTIQQELVAGGFLGRKAGRGFYDYTPGIAHPPPSVEPPQARPTRVVVRGDLGPAAPLIERLRNAGISVDEDEADPAFPDGALSVAGAWLALTDGRTATARAAASGGLELAVFDLAHDYSRCSRIAAARADSCSDVAWSSAAGALQAMGIAVARLDDVAGLVVMRIVSMLANEAAEAVTQHIATARDVDVAMQLGVNYPRGPLAWADAIGLARVRAVISNLAAHYGEDRYRLSPLIARRCAGGGRLVD